MFKREKYKSTLACVLASHFRNNLTSYGGSKNIQVIFKLITVVTIHITVVQLASLGIFSSIQTIICSFKLV